MAAKIKKEAGSPKFRQLKEILKAEIKRLGEGDRFYNQHEAMRKFKVSCATVTRAMSELVTAGYLVRKTGGGTFVRSRNPALPLSGDNKESGLLLALVSKPAGILKAADPLNWFVRDDIQRGVIHSWPGVCRIIDMEELAENPGLCCAVVFINPAEDAEEFLSARRVNYVIVNQTQKPGMEFNCVNTTHMTGVFEAVSYLVKELGHKRVAIITAENSSHAERLAAFQIGLRTFSLPLPDEYLARAAGGTVEAGAEAMRKLLALKEPPTAVFADTDIKAAGVMIAVKEAGLKVPDDISVIGFDDIPEAKTLSPPLTTVKGMYFEMGAAAARMIEERREQSMKDIPSVTVNTKLAVRKSCRKAPATSAF